MNRPMTYGFGWKALRCFLLGLTLFFNLVYGQKSVYMSLYQSKGINQWTIDLSSLEPGDKRYLIVNDTSNLAFWQEFSDKTILGFFDYAMPRFTTEYDSFDCMERTLIAKNDSVDNEARGGGEIMGIPGTQMQRVPSARGQSSDILLRVLKPNENSVFQTWLESGQWVVEIRLDEQALKKKRILVFEQATSTVPYCIERTEMAAAVLPVHLFTISGEERILPKKWENPQESISLVLPPEVMTKRRHFQDMVLETWSKAKEPVLLYSWDIGLIGGDKCSPCVAPPPDFSLFETMGMDSVPEHMYVNYMIFSPTSARGLSACPFEKFQWIFAFHVPAKGFLDCEEADLYRQELKERQEEEHENLVNLLGDSSKTFVE